MPKVVQDRKDETTAPLRRPRGRNKEKVRDFVEKTGRLKWGLNTRISETFDQSGDGDAPTPGLFYGDYPTVSSTTVSTPRETTTSKRRKKRSKLGDDEYDFPDPSQYVSVLHLEDPTKIGGNVGQRHQLDDTLPCHDVKEAAAYALPTSRDHRVTPTDATKLAPAHKAQGSPHDPIVHVNSGQLNTPYASNMTGFDDQHAAPAVNTVGGAPLRGMPRQSPENKHQQPIIAYNGTLPVHGNVVLHTATSAVAHMLPPPAAHGTHGTPIPTHDRYLNQAVDAVCEEPNDWSILFANHLGGGFPAVDGFPNATQRENVNVQTGRGYNVVGDYINNDHGIDQLLALEQPMVESAAVTSETWWNPSGYANRISGSREPPPSSFQAPPNTANGYPVTPSNTVPSITDGYGGLYIPPTILPDGSAVNSAQFAYIHAGGSAMPPVAAGTMISSSSSSHIFPCIFGDTGINGLSTDTYFAIPPESSVQNPPTVASQALDLLSIDQFPALGLHPGEATPQFPNAYTNNMQQDEVQEHTTPRGGSLFPMVVIKWIFKFTSRATVTQVITPTRPYPQQARAICPCGCAITTECWGPPDSTPGHPANSDEGTYHFIATHMKWTFYMGDAWVETKGSQITGNKSTTSCALCEAPVSVRWSLAVGHDNDDCSPW